MQQTVKNNGVASIEELRSICIEADVKLVACQMTVRTVRPFSRRIHPRNQGLDRRGQLFAGGAKRRTVCLFSDTVGKTSFAGDGRDQLQRQSPAQDSQISVWAAYRQGKSVDASFCLLIDIARRGLEDAVAGHTGCCPVNFSDARTRLGEVIRNHYFS